MYTVSKVTWPTLLGTVMYCRYWRYFDAGKYVLCVASCFSFDWRLLVKEGITGELEGGGSVAVVVGVSDR